MSVAATCPLCDRTFAWSEVPPGATAVTCPNCAVPVEVERAPPPLPPPVGSPLVPTFPRPQPPPPGMAIVRAPPPASALPVLADGDPFRTAARPFIERRSADKLEIVFPRRRGEGRVSVGAVVWSGLWAVLLGMGAAQLTTALVIGAPPTVISLLLRRRRNRIVLTPTTIAGTGTRAVRRDRVSHIFCVGVYDGSWSNVLWHVRLRAGTHDYLVAVTDSLDDANSLAALLASELGLPTWVPPSHPARR